MLQSKDASKLCRVSSKRVRKIPREIGRKTNKQMERMQTIILTYVL